MTSHRLTRLSVAAITVPEGKYSIFVWDSEVPGFGVKAASGGSRRWVLQYRPAGERTAKRLTIGPVEGLSLDDARKQARRLLAGALTGNDPHAAKAKAKADAAVTFLTVAERYLAQAKERLRPGTYYQVQLHVLKHGAPLHRLPLGRVRRSDIAALLTTLARTSGGVSANRTRAALSAFFAWAIGHGLTEANPVTGTLKPAEERSRERVLSETELAAVWNACRDDAHGRIVRLLILTGQRRDEVGGLSDGELDLDGGLWTLPASRAKNDREHLIHLSAPAVDILRDAPRVIGRPYLFGERDAGFSGWSRCKSRLDARIAETGKPLPSWTLHDLRRTCATMMGERLGTSPHVIESILNHTGGFRAGVAGVYNRGRYLTEMRETLDAWGAHVIELARKETQQEQNRVFQSRDASV